MMKNVHEPTKLMPYFDHENQLFLSHLQKSFIVLISENYNFDFFL